MALKWFDRIRDVTSSTGTGGMTLANTPPTNYLSLNSRYSTNDQFVGLIVNQTASEWEVSLCQYNGANQFTRQLVYDGSSGAGSLVNFSAGTKDFAVVRAATYSHREVLTANRTYYVRTGGSNNNSGLVNTDAGAFADYNFAVDFIAENLDTNGFIVTISIQNAAWTIPLVVDKSVTGGASSGQAQVIFDFNGGSLTTTSADCISLSAVLTGPVQFQNVTLSTVTSGTAVVTPGGKGQIWVGAGVTFGACVTDHVFINNVFCIIVFLSSYTISGGTRDHWIASNGGQIFAVGVTITLSGTPAFSRAFANALTGAGIQCNANTFSGSATGVRYIARTNGNVITNGNTQTYLPGNADGITDTGGNYS